MSDQWLRDELRGAVPEPPKVSDRAAGARAKARRARRRTTIGVAVGAAAVVVVAALPAFVRDGEPRLVPLLPEPSATASTAPASTACPAPDAPPTGPARLPEGATTVRMCPGPGIGIDAPADALVTGVPELVDVVNAQSDVPSTMPCTMELGRGYQLVFGYPDGRTQAVTGELYGCRHLRVGTSVRGHADRPYRTFVRALRTQRATQEPPAGAATRPACDRSGFESTSPVGWPREMVIGTLCVRFATQTEHDPVDVPVADDDLRVLLTDWVRADPPAYDPDAPTLLLVGETAWGDRVSLTMDQVRERVPGPDARAVLDRLVAEAGRPTPTIDASSSPSDVVAAYGDLLNAGDRAGAAALWTPVVGKPDLPAAYSHVDSQPEGERPMRRISAWRDATAVTALYRVVPPDGSFTEYREAVFLVGRDEQGIFRIVSLEVGDVVPTGR